MCVCVNSSRKFVLYGPRQAFCTPYHGDCVATVVYMTSHIESLLKAVERPLDIRQFCYSKFLLLYSTVQYTKKQFHTSASDSKSVTTKTYRGQHNFAN